MVINIIAILLLARGILSSLPVHGSISLIDDDVISINLHANKAGVGDDLDKLIEKLKVNAKPQIYLNLGKKIIEIVNSADHEQDCFEMNFDKVATLFANNSTTNEFVNIRKGVSKEIFCRNMCNANFTRSMTSHPFIISKLVDNISKILRRVILLIEERRKKIINQDSIHHEDLYFVVPQGYQNSMNIDQEFEYYSPSQILSNIELAIERERLKSGSDLFFEYTKSIQDSLSRLIRLFDVKWRHLHDDFDDSFRWRLLNLQKQAEFLLQILIKENQQQHAEKSKNSANNFSKDKSRNGISNDKEIKIKKTTTLNVEKINNFHKSDKTEMVKNKTQRTDKNITNNKLASIIETRIMSSQLLKNINSPSSKNKNSSAINANNLNNQNFIINKSTKVKSELNNQEVSKTNKFAKIFHDKFFAGLEERGNRSSEAMERAILSGKNITSKSIEKGEQNKVHVMLHKSSKTNVTDKKIPSRRTLQILGPLDESKGKKQKIHHASIKKIEKNSHENVKARINDISAMDEILEAVGEVLPENVEISRRLKRTIPGMS